MIYDGIDLSRYMMTSCARPLMPMPNVPTTARAGCDGFEVGRVRLESVTVYVECTIVDRSALTVGEGILSADMLKHRIAALLFRREKRPLVFDSDPDRYCMAIVTEVSEVERFGHVDRCTIAFLCEPWFYSAEKSLALASGTSALHIGGTLPTRPTFEVTAASAVESITLTNLDTGEFVKVNGSYAKGTVLRIDMQLRRATINGADAGVTLQSDFFELQPGKNNLKLSSGSGIIKYKEVWL